MASYILMSEREIIRDIAKKLKKTRIWLNMSQEYVSRKTGLSLHTISNIENGKTYTLENLIKLLQLYGMVENLNNLIDDPVLSPEQIHIPYERQRVKPSMKQEEPVNWEWGK